MLPELFAAPLPNTDIATFFISYSPLLHSLEVCPHAHSRTKHNVVWHFCHCPGASLLPDCQFVEGMLQKGNPLFRKNKRQLRACLSGPQENRRRNLPDGIFTYLQTFTRPYGLSCLFQNTCRQALRQMKYIIYPVHNPHTAPLLQTPPLYPVRLRQALSPKVYAGHAVLPSFYPEKPALHWDW